MKNPTLKQKVAMYESYLHKINTFIVSSDNEGIKELVENADNWSYAHRVGNGELTDAEQRKHVNRAFWKLCDTPLADKRLQNMRQNWIEMQKNKIKEKETGYEN